MILDDFDTQWRATNEVAATKEQREQLIAATRHRVNRLWGQAEKKDATPEPTVKLGDMAPDFTLMDTKGKPVSLHDFRGKKNVALAFYIFAFTGG